METSLFRFVWISCPMSWSISTKKLSLLFRLLKNAPSSSKRCWTSSFLIWKESTWSLRWSLLNNTNVWNHFQLNISPTKSTSYKRTLINHWRSRGNCSSLTKSRKYSQIAQLKRRIFNLCLWEKTVLWKLRRRLNIFVRGPVRRTPETATTANGSKTLIYFTLLKSMNKMRKVILNALRVLWVLLLTRGQSWRGFIVLTVWEILWRWEFSNWMTSSLQNIDYI